jgi:uncharacterized protein
MNFRDKLATLSAPVSRAAAPAALEAVAAPSARNSGLHGSRAAAKSAARELAEPYVEREWDERGSAGVQASSWSRGPEDTRRLGHPRARNSSDVEAGLGDPSDLSTHSVDRAEPEPPFEDGGSPLDAASPQACESDRAERISQLRSLISGVLARGARWRAPGNLAFDKPLNSRAPGSHELGAGAGPAAAGELGDAALRSRSRGGSGALLAAIADAERATGHVFASMDGSNTAVTGCGAGEFDTAGFSSPVADVDAGARLHMLRDAINGWAPARARLPRGFARQPWATRETPFGPVHVVERWLEPAHRHGTVSVHSALERLPATLAALALDPELAGLDLSRMLFLDTETTGLAGGSGTVAFLVGIACFHDDSLLLTQLLLPNLGGEIPMLVALAEHLAAASCILTYNGKSFDWPLLRTRYVMNRLPVPALPPHVDLLHASRRIWKPRLGSVRLTDVEREIMRFSREGDVDGAEIPSRYFSFLRDGGTEWLVPVLEHNQNDLIALPAMLGVLGARFEQIECDDHALDALAYGKLALRVSDGERAAAFAVAAVAASEGSPLESHAWSFRGEVARRSREAEAAAAHYEQALALCEDAVRRATLHLTLAKLYEHGLQDLRGAYRHARGTELAEGAETQGRRLGRLTRKLERQAAREAELEWRSARERARVSPASHIGE